jgi:putative DNA primase/helicase
VPSKYGAGQEDYQRAEWLAVRLENRWKHDFTADRWHHWDGQRWAPDETEQVKRAVAETAAEALGDLNLGESMRKSLLKLLSITPINRALEALATMPGYGTNGDDWDSDPHLLGVRNGIVDLRLNDRVPASPTMLVTKTTNVKFEPITHPDEMDARAPQFMRAMREWTSGDDDMLYYLLFWFGASMFGFSPEQRFLLMTGIGRNGKGALKHAIMQATGEYGAQYDANLYMRSRYGAARSESARADLIALKGKRITFFSEPEGNRFNEELLKAHTGGDTIAARALFSNNVQVWTPTHSITFLVNDAPDVEDLGPSMGARVMVADFRERFDGDREDKQLYDKLKAEREGVLAILVWAASIWFAKWEGGHGGLVLPERVIEASKQFMERNDPVANAINDVFKVGPEYETNGQAAYDAFKDWWKSQGESEDPMSNVMFARALEKKGFKRFRTAQIKGWKGLKPLGAVEMAEKAADDDEEAPEN